MCFNALNIIAIDETDKTGLRSGHIKNLCDAGNRNLKRIITKDGLVTPSLATFPRYRRHAKYAAAYSNSTFARFIQMAFSKT